MKIRVAINGFGRIGRETAKIALGIGMNVLAYDKFLKETKITLNFMGGNSIDFQFSSPLKSEYNKLLSEHKKNRDAYYNNIEKQLKENLEKRVQVIDKLKHLIEEADTSTMYNKFKLIKRNFGSI